MVVIAPILKSKIRNGFSEGIATTAGNELNSFLKYTVFIVSVFPVYDKLASPV